MIGGWRGLLAGLLLALACALPLRADGGDVGDVGDVATDASRLQRQLAGALREEGVAGAVWATVASDGGITIGAAGLENVLTGEALAPDSKVHVGSLAKSLIATGMLQLVSAGRVDLDAPLDRYLPALRLPNRWQATDPVRVRHLLDHTAHGRANLVAGLLVLQWCAVLAGWGMLPFALWR